MPEETEVIRRIECSIWSNGATGGGIRILGGAKVRKKHFDRDQSPVCVEVDGVQVDCNVDKNTFWNKDCGELIRKPIRLWAEANNLRTGDRVWLEILEPKKRFRLTLG